MSSATLLWFKRDLRLGDHPALHAALRAGGPLVPVYLVEPAQWGERDASARQWDFTRECLQGLDSALRALGSRLVVRSGTAPEALEALARESGAARLVSHEETGTEWSYARDRAVAAWARDRGIAWTELPQSGVVRSLASRDGWAARRERLLRQPLLTTPIALPPVPEALRSEPLPSAQDLGLAPDPAPGRQRGGREAGQALLESFLTERGRDYRRAMSSPLEGATACSRLSPHLALGTLSVREAAQAAALRQAEVRGTRSGWSGATRSFASRLAWRDHFMQKLEDAPDLDRRCLHLGFEGVRPEQPDAARLAAWERGETGLPFVDACMRSLIHTGWLNFRMRSMLVAVASYHLWLDWRVTGQHLARLFTDYEPGIHWSQMQMQSGTTGINTLRIYNPVKQGHDQDPTGAFTRRWLPELAEVPDAFLQEPWRWEGAGRLLGARYPVPLVDLKTAAAEARDRIWAVRRQPGFRAEADRVIARHASRKDSAGHFVNDRAARPRRTAKPSPAQQSFDF